MTFHQSYETHRINALIQFEISAIWLPTGDLSTPLYSWDLDRGEDPDPEPKLSRDDDAEAWRGYIRIIQRLQEQHDRSSAQFYGDSREY